MECLTVDCHASRMARMRSATLTSARLIQAAAVSENVKSWCAFVTLTLRDSDTFEKGQVVTFLSRVKSWYRRNGVPFRYVWVGELQRRGTLHYHLVFWLPPGLMLPKPDRQGWWPWGSSSIERARNVIGYLAKYVTKGSRGGASDFPKGTRIHGSGGLSATAADERRWWLSPSWLRSMVPIEARPFRARAGGGFVARATGECFASLYVVVGIANGFVRLVKRSEWIESQSCSA